MRTFSLLFLACLLAGCATSAHTNQAQPDISQLQRTNTDEVNHTSRASDDVTDAKDLVRRIDYKDHILAQ